MLINGINQIEYFYIDKIKKEPYIIILSRSEFLKSGIDYPSIILRINELITDLYENQHGKQNQFASLIGLKPSVISNWITGFRNPKLSSLKAIADKCNINVEWLVFGTGSKHKDNANNHNLSNLYDKFKTILPDSDESDVQTIASILDNWENISKDDRRKLRHQLEAFLIEAKTVLSQKEDPPPKFSVSVIEIPDRDDDITVRPGDLLALHPPKRRH